MLTWCVWRVVWDGPWVLGVAGRVVVRVVRGACRACVLCPCPWCATCRLTLVGCAAGARLRQPTAAGASAGRLPHDRASARTVHGDRISAIKRSREARRGHPWPSCTDCGHSPVARLAAASALRRFRAARTDPVTTARHGEPSPDTAGTQSRQGSRGRRGGRHPGAGPVWTDAAAVPDRRRTGHAHGARRRSGTGSRVGDRPRARSPPGGRSQQASTAAAPAAVRH